MHFIKIVANVDGDGRLYYTIRYRCNLLYEGYKSYCLASLSEFMRRDFAKEGGCFRGIYAWLDAEGRICYGIRYKEGDAIHKGHESYSLDILSASLRDMLNE